MVAKLLFDLRTKCLTLEAIFTADPASKEAASCVQHMGWSELQQVSRLGSTPKTGGSLYAM